MKKFNGFIMSLFLMMTQLFASNKEDAPFIVGTGSGYAPFVSLTNAGKIEGFDIDVAKEIALKLNHPLVLKDCGNMSSLMLALKQKKVNAII